MKINQLNKRQSLEQIAKWQKVLVTFEKLLDELRTREIPDRIIESVNAKIDLFNAFSGSDSQYILNLKAEKKQILKLVEKELNMVTKNHYQNQWMAVGMCVFGIPFGFVFSQSFDSLAYIGMGLPFGMLLGIGIGEYKDRKAKEKGLQLDIEG
nr:hypothetical protein [uncultured Marinifilum sp.]